MLQDAKRLLAIQQQETLLEVNPAIRPETPLANSCLLTGTRQDPSLVSQLRKELRTADQVDILCSFIKWSGIRVLKEEFELFTHKPNARLRIITT
ncbi:MAG TPA: hypothetical protein VHR86_04540, partial [Armatimonadota bacterium]|nr:hypothetical protein [Armatimonadota bacterium]